MTLNERLAQALNATPMQVAAAVQLLDEGATVPFIARYRKEVTGGLSDTQLRLLQERLLYLRELAARRTTILNSIQEQNKLTDELKNALLAAETKTELEDLYLPYKPKRRTKAQLAREAGLAPLAEQLLQDPTQAPTALAMRYLNPEQGIADVSAALDGARQILMEQFAEDALLLGQLREYLWENALLVAQVIAEKAAEGQKFADYFDYREPLQQIPSHRALALFRGRQEGVLQLTLELPSQEADTDANHEVDGQQAASRATATLMWQPCESQIAHRFQVADHGRAADAWLRETVRWAWRVKMLPHLDTELKQRLREMAEEQAIQVFAINLRDLLLAAPAGTRPTMGLDPGLRTGVKVAVVDGTGKLLDTATIYPHAPQHRWEEAIHQLAELARRHAVTLISIGNGTASRETDKLVADLMRRHADLRLQKMVVSEAGASVYSASEQAALEFPDLDVSLRGAVSIARRLQDPLAELVKIEPKAIGVGQYQHDVSQTRLARMLDAVVEDCVNAVGVDVNTASIPLLTRVAGLNATVARALVEYRNTHGVFTERCELLQVPRLGAKTFEQAAGFLRIPKGRNPLDASAVHPEAYPVVERILKICGQPIEQVMGNRTLLQTLAPEWFVDDRFGVPTVRDILAELEKPGRDPRPQFKTATFQEGIETLADVKPGLVLEGVVTNVTHFGAFVDVGVHQDGLVHISALADRFVKDPREVVKAGDIVTVKVLEVDPQRKRIALTMRLQDEAASRPSLRSQVPPRAQGEVPNNADLPKAPHKAPPREKSQDRTRSRSEGGRPEASSTALAEAFRQARRRGHKDQDRGDKDHDA